MRDQFEPSLDKVLVHEGGYIDHPADPGGATMKGVTQAVYNGWRDRHGLPRQSVRKISTLELRDIYRRQYWNAIRGDDLPKGVDYVVFDGAVNSGPSRSVRWLQKALGGVKVDGEIGEATLRACREHPNHDELVAKICAIRLGFVRGLKTWKVFGKGWASRISGVKAVGQAWATGANAPEVCFVDGCNARAEAKDLDRPTPQVEDAADAAVLGGPITSGVSEAAQQLEPLQHTHEVVGWIFAGLTILGLVLLFGGLALRHWNKRKERRAREAEQSLVEAAVPELAEAA